MTQVLPDGARLLPLQPHPDDRGVFTEIYREEWPVPVRFQQWNVVNSKAGVLRGVHVHIKHADYLTVISGSASFMLKDLRRGSPTEHLIARVDLSSTARSALYIPPGVAHGFYFHTDSIHVYAVTHYWNMDDELGCRFDDPDLGISWPNKNPKISDRDRDLPPLKTILASLPSYAESAHKK